MSDNGCMSSHRLSTFLLLAIAATLSAQTPAPQAPPAAPQVPRPASPTRDPHTPGYVTAKELPDGAIPPPDADGNFILGPTHPAATEMTPAPGIPTGNIIEFTMTSPDTKFYPAIARDPGPLGPPDPQHPAKLIFTARIPPP